MSRMRMPRVSIRGLLVLILVVGAALGAWLVPYRQYRRQVDAAKRLMTPKTIITRMDTEPSIETRPCWQARLIGDKRTGPVTTLRFYESVIGEEIARVAEFRDLEALEFHVAIDPKGDGLAPLAGLPSLRSLELEGSGWKDLDLAVLKGFRRLEELDLDDESFTDAGLAHLGELSGLRKLRLGCEDRTDAGLAFLGRMKGLRSLSLYASSATDAVLDPIRTLPSLERLSLIGVPITDAGMSRLVGLDRLERLFIQHSKLDGRGLAVLARLPRLRELVLWSNDDLRNEELDQLRQATQLRSLTLMYNDGLSDPCLKSLMTMTYLEELRIATQVGGFWSDATAGELKKALPDTKIELDYSRSNGTEGSLSTNFAWPSP
jgi:hypothetical protein